MLMQNFKYIQFIKFDNLQNFNFDNNFYVELNFDYKGKKYRFKVYKPINFSYIAKNEVVVLEQRILIEDMGSMLVEANKNTVLKHKDFYFCFMQENQELGEQLFNIDTIFKNYKLGILSNVV